MKPINSIYSLSALIILMTLPATAADTNKEKNITWTEPASALKEDPDFSIQGGIRKQQSGHLRGRSGRRTR